jgi:hypothetical protein
MLEAAYGPWDLGIALLSAALLLAALRARARPLALCALALLPVALVYAWNPDNRVYSYHGLMHVSVVYQILEQGLPAGNPLLAGEPFRFAWGPHALAAGVSRVFGASPAWAFAALNLCALAVSVCCLFRLGLRVCGDARAAAFGVVAALYGFTFVQVFERLPAGFGWLDTNGLAPITKFSNMTALPLGVACCAVFLDALAGIAEPGPRDRRRPLLVFASVAGAALLYPLLWLGMGAGAAGAGGLLLLRGATPPGRLLRDGALPALLGSLAALPYLVAVGVADAEEAARLASPAHAARYALDLLFPALPLAALLVFSRRPLAALARERRDLVLLLGGFAAANALVALWIEGPVEEGIEYKYRMLACLTLGPLAGLALETLRRRSTAAAVALVALLLVPAANDLRFKATRGGVLDPFVERGTNLVHAEPGPGELYGWIARETPADAAFVDAQLALPAFARRALFVGLHSRARRVSPGRYHDGWLLDPETAYPELVGGLEETRARLPIARRLLAGRELDRAARELERAVARAELGPVYVVARDAAAAERLAAHASFAPVFRNETARVFRFAPRAP